MWGEFYGEVFGEVVGEGVTGCDLVVVRKSCGSSYASALQLRIEIFMRPDREQNQRLGRQLVWLQPVGQQSLLLVEFEFVDEHAAEVAPFFFTSRGVAGDATDCGVQHGFFLRMKLFKHSRKRGRDQNG